MKWWALFVTPMLASCVTTGNSRLEVRLIDQKTQTPVVGAPAAARYLTMFPAPMAMPRVVKRTSDAKGEVIFERLADGYWNVTAVTNNGELQSAFFNIYQKRLCGGGKDQMTRDGGYVGGVEGNPYAKPSSPVVFYGKLLQ